VPVATTSDLVTRSDRVLESERVALVERIEQLQRRVDLHRSVYEQLAEQLATEQHMLREIEELQDRRPQLRLERLDRNSKADGCRRWPSRCYGVGPAMTP
jgi:hypothetical protein